MAAPAAPARLSADFWKYWSGQTVNNLGSSFTQFALPLLVYKLTGSAVNLALTTAAAFLPYLLFGLVIGAWVDRADRKRLMIATNLVSAAVIASVPLVAWLGSLTVWWIYAVAFASTTMAVVFNTAEFAAIPSLVSSDNLVTANGRITASFSAAFVVGPLLGGALLAFFPVQNLLLIDAASFLVSTALLGLIRTSFNKAPAKSAVTQSIRRDIVAGLRYVFGHPVLRAISIMMALVNFVGVSRWSQIVLFAKERLAASDSQIGLLYSAGGLGVVVLGLAAGPLRRRWSFGQVALGALMANAVLMFAFAFNRWYWLAILLWGAQSGLAILFNINTGSLRQAITPNHLLGRVVSIAGVIAWSANPLGALLGGIAIERTHNVALVYAVISVLVFLIPVGFAFSPLGHAERYLPPKSASPAAESA
jgi:MFS family permease